MRFRLHGLTTLVLCLSDYIVWHLYLNDKDDQDYQYVVFQVKWNTFTEQR